MRRMSLAAVLAIACAALATAVAPPVAGASTATVEIFVPLGDPGPGCRRVFGLPRTVRAPRVLTSAMTALLRGPTAAERRKGYGGWLSRRRRGCCAA